MEDALDLLANAFSERFIHRVGGKTVLDFGCGSGWQSIALALKGAQRVLGVDIDPEALATARHLSEQLGVQHRTEFRTCVEARHRGQFDIVISQNSFEHFSKPGAVLENMKSALKPQGRIYITFGNPWFSPYGSHMHFFTKLPYVNLLFSEATVMRVRSLYRNDGARYYTDVEGGLNKMTVRRFKKLVSRSGLSVISFKCGAVKRLQFLTVIPLLRELFVNRVSCILMRQ